MKTIHKSTIIFFAVVFAACQNDINDAKFNDGEIDSNELVVANGMIQSPQWLAHVVDTVARRYNPFPETGNYPYPWVYSVKYNNQDYLYVLDGLSSCAVCGSLFFTLSGEPVEGFPGKPGENLYRELSAAIKDRTLLWRHGDDFPITKAFGSVVSVYTPKGNLVSDTYYRSEEYSSLDKLTILSNMATEYSQATVVAEATSTYNCHAYAWHMTEGGSPVWMGANSNPTSIYWLDKSYISTSGAATKVAYLSDNHSAVTTGTPDVFISKWGAWPLVRHHKNYGPYNASQLSYLKKNDIPSFYISNSASNYSGSSSIYAVGGYAGISLNAYATNTTPTSYTWSADFYGDCDRWYIWPSGSKADISVYLNAQHSGGSLRIICAMYNGSTLLGSATYYLSVYPNSSNNNILPEEDLVFTILDE